VTTREKAVSVRGTAPARSEANGPERGSLVGNARPRQVDIEHRLARRKPWSEIGVWELPRASEFSSDPSLCDLILLIEVFRCSPFAETLEELTNPRKTANGNGLDLTGAGVIRTGRKPLAGDWASASLAYTLSRSPSVQWFYNHYGSTGIWEACGFTARPSYSEVHRRFAELEDRWEAFAMVAQSLIRVAKQAEPRIGQIVALDATGWHSPSALEHCCVDPESCRKAGGDPAARLISDAADAIIEARAHESAGFEPSDYLTGDHELARRERVTLSRADGTSAVYQLYFINGHLYRSLDLTGGFRSYNRNTN
jgi:hypothetical protein